MNELFSQLLGQSAWSIAIFIVLSYVVAVQAIRLFLRPAIVSSLDPLNILLVTTAGFAIIGLLASPILSRSFSPSYWMILIFIGLWLCVIRMAGKPKRIDLRDKMDIDFQMALLMLSISVMVVNLIVNMIIPGKIPLFMENGSGVRFEATENSRLLTWLMLGVSPAGGMVYALTESPSVRRFAAFAVALQVIQGLLFASKGGILSILFILLNSLFVAQQRGESVRYLKLRRAFKHTALGVALLVPFYLAVIGLGGGSAGVVAMRVLGGFDQLILTSQYDLLHRGSELFHTNLLEYQLMPVFKVITTHKYAYSSIGQYVIEGATGTYIDGPFTLPNSNLILETLLTSGTTLGMLLFCVELTAFYWLRRVTFSQPLTPLTFVIAVQTVFAPIALFVSGQEWFTETLLLSLTVGVAYGLAHVWKALRLISSVQT